jgi:hypothetical protein
MKLEVVPAGEAGFFFFFCPLQEVEVGGHVKMLEQGWAVLW